LTELTYIILFPIIALRLLLARSMLSRSMLSWGITFSLHWSSLN